MAIPRWPLEPCENVLVSAGCEAPLIATPGMLVVFGCRHSGARDQRVRFTALAQHGRTLREANGCLSSVGQKRTTPELAGRSDTRQVLLLLSPDLPGEEFKGREQGATVMELIEYETQARLSGPTLPQQPSFRLAFSQHSNNAPAIRAQKYLRVNQTIKINRLATRSRNRSFASEPSSASMRPLFDKGFCLRLPECVLPWLDEVDPASDVLDVSMLASHVIRRLTEQGQDREMIEGVQSALAPLEFWTREPAKSVWNSYFAPRLVAGSGREEYPCLALLTHAEAEEWERLTSVLRRPVVRARFADVLWELGARVAGPRKDLHLFARRAADLYLDAADVASGLASSISLIEIVTRSMSLGQQLRSPEVINRGFRRLMDYGTAAEQKHLGLWKAPFDHLIWFKGLTGEQRQEVLRHHEARLNASIVNSDIHQIKMAGGALTNYFHAHKDYEQAKEITLRCGNAVLEIADGMRPSDAAHHVKEVMHWYRQVGLRDEAERVHVFLERCAKAGLADMKLQRAEIPVDNEQIDKHIAQCLSVSRPLMALSRLAEHCAPTPERIRRTLTGGGYVSHRIMPVSLVGDHGLPVRCIGTDEEDVEGHVFKLMADEMSFGAMVFASGIDQLKERFELGKLPDMPEIFDCPLIPGDRVELYRAGLAAFDAGDYIKCVHVLVPQIENCLRVLVAILGGSETKAVRDGSFDLKNMNDVLCDPSVQEALEEKLLCFLRVLYCDKGGMNLRNLVAHGAAPVGVFNRVTASLVIQSIALLSTIGERSR